MTPCQLHSKAGNVLPSLANLSWPPLGPLSPVVATSVPCTIEEVKCSHACLNCAGAVQSGLYISLGGLGQCQGTNLRLLMLLTVPLSNLKFTAVCIANHESNVSETFTRCALICSFSWTWSVRSNVWAAHVICKLYTLHRNSLMQGLCGILNPTVNSYKRIDGTTTASGSSWAPTSVSYSGNNRTHMFR